MSLPRGLLIVVLLAAAVAPAHALTDEEERAKAHFLAGQSYYDQASYADALKEFNEAYRLSKKPALLYNIARCDEALDDYAGAVTMLERFLAEDPTTPDRAAVEARIAALQERQREAGRRRSPIPSAPNEPVRPPPVATPAPPPVAASAPVTAPAPRKRTWTWVVGGVGVAALIAAAATGIESQILYNELNGKCAGNLCSPSVVSSPQAKIDRGRQLALATDVLWPVGAVAVGAAIALFFVEGRHAPRHARLVPLVSPSTGGLAVARDF